MPHVVFICTANICRSPVAEGLLRNRLQQQGRAGWRVSSAGTWAQLKRGAARHSIDLMAEKGIDIRDHQAQEVNAALLQEADLLLCMEPGHAEALRAEFPQASHKIYLLSEMDNRRYGIDDPYGGPYEGYKQMLADVEQLIDAGLPRIIELTEQNAIDNGA